MAKIKIGIVNYLNTRPLLYGIEKMALQQAAELLPNYPSKVAASLLAGDIDLGLVPVAVIPQLREAHIVSDYCIGCDGPVASVAIFSERPIGQVKRLLLDYQSRTSVALARVLLREYWKLDLELVDAQEGYQSQISGETAGVLIGDRALEQRLRSPFTYDLGEAWKAYTGLPFVFAAWVSNRPLEAEFVKAFNEANAVGLRHIPEIVAANPFPAFDLQAYYTRHISYLLDTQKRKALALFLDKCKG